MKTRLSPAAEFFATVFLVLFLLATPLAFYAETAERLLFQPGVYTEALQALNFYNRFPALIAGRVSQNAGSLPGTQNGVPGDNPNTGEELQYLGSSDYEAILASLFPPEWLKPQTESVIDQLFNFLNFQSPALSLKVSMIDVKARLQGQQGAEIALRIIKSWPPCTVSQLLEFAGLGISGKLQGMPVCQPPEALLPIVTPFVQAGLNGVASQIPDQVDLAGLLMRGQNGFILSETPAAGVGVAALSLRQWYAVFRWSLRLSPLLPVIFLVLFTWIAVRDGRGLFTWWGGAFLGAGLLAALSSLAAGALLFDLMHSILQALWINPAPALFQFSNEMARYVILRYTQWVGLEGVILLVAGGIILIGSLFFKRA